MNALQHITIVLVRPQQPGNIGVAARAIANYGIGRLAMVCPAGFDPERARWMAPKAHHIIDHAHYCRTVSEAVADSAQVIATTARPRTQEWTVRYPGEAAQFVASNPVRTAILFGPEDNGLSNDDLALAESILTFPTTHISSMNLGQAVTATCAALRMAHTSKPAIHELPVEQVSIDKREALVQRSMHILDTCGYLDGRSRRIVNSTLVRLAARAELSDDEANNLMGMMKQVNWWIKMQSS